MRASWYAKALYVLATSGKLSEDKLVEHFWGTISQNGHTHMLHKVLRAYEHILATHEKQETILITTATVVSEAEVGQLLRRESFTKLLSGNHRRVQRKVDPSIIGGAIAQSSTMRVDGSHKQKLLDIYQSLTSR